MTTCGSRWVVLVILHHVAVIYAANTPFYYVEPTKNYVAILVLVFFPLLNQAFFMGLLFPDRGVFHAFFL